MSTALKKTWPVLALMLLCLALRIPNLTALPIFGDEAIYLRWAQLVGAGHPWVSLADPKPPLHFWLLSLVCPLASDPLVSARLLSVVAGMLSVPLLIAIAGELNLRATPRTAWLPERIVGYFTVILFLICPFLAFYQRLSTQDALFTCESLAVVWLSLRWCRTLTWPTALALGIAIALTLHTRQGISYTLALFPVILWGQRLLSVPNWRKGTVQLFCLALLGAALWSPYLLANLPGRPLSDEGSGEIKRRIFYQDSFSATSGHLEIAFRNARLAFIPEWKNGEPVSGWLYLYLTPPLYVLAIAGFIGLLVHRRDLFFPLALWAFLLLAPPIVLGNTIYSRYLLASVPPLLLAGGYFLTQLTGVILKACHNRLYLGVLATLLLWAGVLIWPLKELHTQTYDWSNQTLTARDRYQYLTGWTAGYATRDALRHLRELSEAGPIAVITTDAWGTPSDALWTYFSGKPNIELYYTGEDQILRPGNEPETYLLKRNKWLYPPESQVHFKPEVKVYFVTNDPVHAATADVPAASFFQGKNSNFGPGRTFKGVDGSEGVTVFPVILK